MGKTDSKTADVGDAVMVAVLPDGSLRVWRWPGRAEGKGKDAWEAACRLVQDGRAKRLQGAVVEDVPI